MSSVALDPGDSTEYRPWRKSGVTKRKIFVLPFEFIPRALNEAKQIIRLCSAGCFVEKIQNVTTCCTRFVRTDVSSSLRRETIAVADCSKSLKVCVCDFIVENELSTRRQKKTAY